MRYFILMIDPIDNGPVAMLDEDSLGVGEISLFDSYEEAEEIGDSHPTSSAWGYRIYEWEEME